MTEKTDQEFIDSCADTLFALEAEAARVGDAGLTAAVEAHHAALNEAQVAFAAKYGEGGIATRSGGTGNKNDPNPPSDPNP